MKQRVITAVVAIGLFLPLLFWLPAICLTLAMGALCAVGVWELLYATHSCPKHPFLWISCAAAFLVPLTVSRPHPDLFWLLLTALAYMIAGFACAVFDHEHITYDMLGKGVLAAILLPMMFASVLRIRNGENGALLVLMPWITVWTCDSAAMLVGRALGRRKLAPYVSPKKTVEGTLGGLVFAMAACGLYAFVMQRFFALEMGYLPAVLYGAVGSSLGQLGDLSLSVIKRGAGIKDYGRLFPGHGGVWDRFDSILFAAPVFELAYQHILPRIFG